MSKNRLNATLTHRIDVSPEHIVLRIVPTGWDLPSFTPGQFAVLGLPPEAPRLQGADDDIDSTATGKLIKRAYSITSSSVPKEYVEFYVALVLSGALTPRLFELEVGDKLWMSPKFTGMFTLDQVAPDKNVVFAATGTGIAPYMSMLRTHLEAGHARKFAVLHGALHSWDLGYRDELALFDQKYANFSYVPIVSEPGYELDEWRGPTGFLQDYWVTRPFDVIWGSTPEPKNTHVFLCGNPLMIQNMQRVLEEEGFKEHTKKRPGQIHMEKYW
ncbi:MAG: ferredoxin--NADP reductase [Candidatus Latescibacterota bacterium]|nr:MAG: ferredoxin--NADP reductase [Candidatus Latescibacterota bacterium]